MLDLDLLRRAADAGDGAEEVPVTRRWLGQLADEVEAYRNAALLAQERDGQVFGLPQGQRL